MPAKSKDQQRAAGIALQAKREGKVDELPAGAAKQMAKSMSEKELDKMASTKHKGLPEKKKEKNESRQWAGASLIQVFKEENLELADKAKENDEEEITTQKSKVDRIDDKEIGNGKSAEDSWTSASGGTAPAIANNARGPMTSNTAGARVAEQIDLNRWQELAGLEITSGLLVEKEEKKEAKDNKVVKKNRTKIDESIDPNSLDHLFEASYWDEPESDWDEPWSHGAAGASEELSSREEEKMIDWLLDDAKRLGIAPKEQYEDLDDLFNDVFGYYPERDDKEAEEAAWNAVKRAQEFWEAMKDSASDKITKEEMNRFASLIKEMDTAQTKNYVRRLAKHGWSWEEVAEQLKTQYGVRPYEIDKVLLPYWKEITEDK